MFEYIINRLVTLSMGIGQEKVAMELIYKAAENGQWICIKNVHLSMDWLAQLEKNIEEFSTCAHSDFRLWLTTEPIDDFPLTLIESSYVIPYEAPPGIKENIIRTYEKWDQEYNVNMNQNSHQDTDKLMFILAWIHSLIIERSNYNQQGWNGNYDFHSGDLRAGRAIILDSLENASNSYRWDVIHGLFLEFVYGGRIDDDIDKKILCIYLNKFFNDEIMRGEKELFHGWRFPKKFDIQARKGAIIAMSQGNDPLHLGLPINIKTIMNKNISEHIIQKIVSIESQTKKLDPINQQKLIEIINPFSMYWEKIKCNIEENIMDLLDDTRNSDEKKMLEKDVVQLFLNNEFRIGVTIFRTVNFFFQETMRNEKGNKTSDETEEEIIHDCLLELARGKIPEKWKVECWHGPKSVFKWLSGLVQRVEYIQMKIQNRYVKIIYLFERTQLSIYFVYNILILQKINS